jgi:hypothetical protein
VFRLEGDIRKIRNKIKQLDAGNGAEKPMGVQTSTEQRPEPPIELPMKRQKTEAPEKAPVKQISPPKTPPTTNEPPSEPPSEGSTLE